MRPSSVESAIFKGVLASFSLLKTRSKWPSFSRHIEMPESGFFHWVGAGVDQVLPPSVDSELTIFGRIRR